MVSSIAVIILLRITSNESYSGRSSRLKLREFNCKYGKEIVAGELQIRRVVIWMKMFHFPEMLENAI